MTDTQPSTWARLTPAALAARQAVVNAVRTATATRLADIAQTGLIPPRSPLAPGDLLTARAVAFTAPCPSGHDATWTSQQASQRSLTRTTYVCPTCTPRSAPWTAS